MYHYAGNNPIKYTDSDGRAPYCNGIYDGAFNPKKNSPDPVNGPKLPLAEVRNEVATAVGNNYSDMVPSGDWGPRPSIDTPQGATIDGHNGMDFVAKEGTRVNSVMDGTVVYTDSAGTDGSGYGKYTVIKNKNGTHSLYGHQNLVDVKKGEQVKAGQMIGTVGSTGKSTGPHLHLGFDGNGDGKFSRVQKFDDPARLLYSGE